MDFHTIITSAVSSIRKILNRVTGCSAWWDQDDLQRIAQEIQRQNQELDSQAREYAVPEIREVMDDKHSS